MKAKNYSQTSRAWENILWTLTSDWTTELLTGCLSTAGITLRSLALFTWNKSKGETVCLVVIYKVVWL